MTSTPAPKLITGEMYKAHGLRERVIGWLVQRPNLNGLGADTLVPVTLLTADGERYRNVLVRVIDILHAEPRNFAHFTDHMLWRVAEIDMGGLGERALAELAYRERLALKEKVREQSARLEGSKRAAAMLMGRV
jgi:hypothetical protein